MADIFTYSFISSLSPRVLPTSLVLFRHNMIRRSGESVDVGVAAAARRYRANRRMMYSEVNGEIDEETMA